jgi:calmodulin
MIWEVDEDHDGCVAWEEFQAAYLRCAADRASSEPRQLHNVVLFALHAAPGAARLTAEQATRLTYLQYGREALDAQLAATFGAGSATTLEGKNGGEEWKGGALTLDEFVRCMTTRHLRRGPQRGARAAAKKG